MVHYVFNDLSTDILLTSVAHSFFISTYLRYVDIADFVNFLKDFKRYKVEFPRVNCF